MANVSSTARQAKRGAERAASGDKIEKLARAGYLTKGVVYTIIGVLAFQAAIGAGGQTSGSRGAIREIAEQPFGQFLLILTAIGLLGYAIWRFIEAIKDPEGKGSDAEGIVKRLGYAGSGVIHAFLAFYAASIVFGWSTGSSGGSGGGKEAWTAQLLAQPFGQWLVGLAGAITIGVGLYQFYKAYKAKFMEKYKTGEMSPTERTWAERLGRFGLSARGVVFSLIGFFLIQAALQSDASETKGLGGVLDTLAQQPYGPWLLGLVALGLIAYAVHCFARARYRRLQTG